MTGSSRTPNPAPAEQEKARAELARIFEQAPVAIAVLRGPDLVYELANPRRQPGEEPVSGRYEP